MGSAMALIALSAPSGRPAIKAAGTGEREVASGAALLINQSPSVAHWHSSGPRLLAHKAEPQNTWHDPLDLPVPSSSALVNIFLFISHLPLCFYLYFLLSCHYSLSSSLPGHAVVYTTMPNYSASPNFSLHIFQNLIY